MIFASLRAPWLVPDFCFKYMHMYMYHGARFANRTVTLSSDEVSAPDDRTNVCVSCTPDPCCVSKSILPTMYPIPNAKAPNSANNYNKSRADTMRHAPRAPAPPPCRPAAHRACRSTAHAANVPRAALSHTSRARDASRRPPSPASHCDPSHAAKSLGTTLGQSNCGCSPRRPCGVVVQQ